MFNFYILNLTKRIRGKFELPMNEEEFEKKYNNLISNKDEYILENFPSIFFNMKDVDDIRKINELLNEISDFEVLKYICKYGENLEKACDIIKKQNYSIFHDISEDEELGYYIVQNGLFSIDIPEQLINYIDYESIGRDYRINNSIRFVEVDGIINAVQIH